MAIYKPTFFSPNIDDSIDMSEPQIFSAVLTSKVTDYQIRIADNAEDDPAVFLYDTGKINLSEPMYLDDQLIHYIEGYPALISFEDTSGVYIKKAGFQVNFKNTQDYKVTFFAENTGLEPIYLKVYVDGAPAGTERVLNFGGSFSFEEIITDITYQSEIEIYVKTSGGFGFFKDFYAVAQDSLPEEMKWTMQVWNDAETIELNYLREIFFTNYLKPSISLSLSSDPELPTLITSQKYDFQATISPSSSSDAYRYKYLIYSYFGELLSETDWIYNNSLKYTFRGFINSLSYQVQVKMYDLNGFYAESDIYYIDVNYETFSTSFSPIVENLEEESCVKVDWSGAYLIEGSLISGSIDYLYGGIKDDNYSLYLNSDSIVKWDQTKVEEDYTYIFLWKPEFSSFTGDITKLSNLTTGDFYILGYDYSLNKFYRNINGRFIYTEMSYVLNTNNVYLFGLQSDRLYIKIFT